MQKHPGYENNQVDPDAEELFYQGKNLQAELQAVAALEKFRHAIKLVPNNIDWHITLAQHCSESGPFSIAVNAWKQVLKLEPNNESWLIQYALMLDMAGQAEQAVMAYRTAQNVADKVSATALGLDAYCEALARSQNGKHREAQDFYIQAIEQMGNQVPAQWFYRLSMSFYRAGNYTEAEAPMREAIEHLPNNHHYVYALAEIMRRQGYIEQEVKILQQALTVLQSSGNPNPNQKVEAKWYFELGTALHKINRFDEASTAYQQALMEAPEKIDTLLCLAQSSVAAEQYVVAEDSYHKILNLNTEKAKIYYCEAYYGLGVIKAAQGRHKAALEYYEKSLQMSPKHADCWYAQGLSQQALGLAVIALQSFKNATELNPANIEWQITLAKHCEKSGPFSTAAQAWAQALKIEPNNGKWLMQHALMLDMSGNVAAATIAYKKLLEIKKFENLQQESSLEMYCQALAYSQERKHSDAQGLYEQALACRKEEAPAQWYYRLSASLIRCQRQDEAEAPLKQAIVLAPGNHYYIYSLAELMRRQGLLDQEAVLLRQALELLQSAGNANPNSKTEAQWSYELYKVLEQTNHFAEAAQALQRALLITDPSTFSGLINIERNLFNTDEEKAFAEQIYQHLLTIENESGRTYHAAAYYNLGRLKAAQEEHASALNDYQQALALSPKHAASWHALGQSQQALQQPVAALESFQRAAQVEPEHTEWQLALAQYSGQSGPFATAANAWAQALKAEPDNRDWQLQHALMLDMAGKIPEAQKAYARLLEQEKPDNKPDATETPPHPLALYCEALALVHNKQHKDAQQPFAQALELMGEQAPAHWHFRYGAALFRGGRAADAEAPLQQAIRLLPGNHYYVYALAEAIRRQGRTWQEVEVLQQALDVLQAESNPNPNPGVQAKWCFELGEAQDKMNRFAEAGAAFAQANALKPHDAMQHFREGYAWERAGETRKAQAAYALAQQHDKKLNSKTFGIGVFHQARGFWPQAAEAYEQQNKNNPTNGELLYRLGMAHDRCYRWEQAAQCYRQALVFEPHKPDWHYRLGFVLERQEQWQEAARYYRFAAATRDKHTPYWFYRLGYVLNKAGEQEKACRAFLQTRTEQTLASQSEFLWTELDEEEQKIFIDSLIDEQKHFIDSLIDEQKQQLQQLIASDMPLHSNNPAQAYYTLGQQAERREMWQEAAELYQQAVRRSNEHQPEMYYRLGYVLMRLNKLEQSVDAFLNTRVFKQPDGIDMSRYQKDSGMLQVMEYIEYFQTLTVLDKTIVYESYAGSSISCNPFAIYREMIDHPDYLDWQHIWVINDALKIPEGCKGRENVIFVQRDSSLYLRYLATAKWLVNNSTFPSYFIRRKEQKYLNTWHGTPLKTLGRDMRGRILEHKNGARNFLQATHLLSPNAHTSDIMLNGFDVSHLYSGKFLEAGYPRADLTVHATENEKQAIFNRLHINNEKPVILYAPTWRGTHDSVSFDVERLHSDLKALEKAGYQVLFRGHSLAESTIQEEAAEIKLVPGDIDTNSLLSIVDILITDYSSVFFEYISLKRPIIYYAYDQDEYLAERGMYFGLDEMPGKVCTTQSELLECLKNIDTWITEEDTQTSYSAAINKFCTNDDGNATSRAVNWFFKDKALPGYESSTPLLNTNDTVLMFCGPFMGNGITSAAVNLCRLAHSKDLPVTLVVDPYGIDGFPDREERFAQLKGIVQTMGRVGRLTYGTEEKWIHDQYMGGKIDQQVIKKQLDALYEREFIRCFGYASLKASINFEGYTRFWVELFSRASNDARKIIYQHNDMYGEYEMKLPYLEGVFKSYADYDAIVSVSPMMQEVNAQKLSKRFCINVDKFTSAVNPLDTWTIYEKAEMPLDEDIAEWLQLEESPVILNIGRLSPEKRHDKLIEAFELWRRSGGNGRLIIAGTGPLAHDIKEKVVNSEFGKDIFLAGQRMNPYPLFKVASCFVLSSDHEGQPITLLESLQLGLPAIATDIPSNRYVLDNGLGSLVENTKEGLCEALRDFHNKSAQKNISKFKVSQYQENSWHFFNVLI